MDFIRMDLTYKGLDRHGSKWDMVTPPPKLDNNGDKKKFFYPDLSVYFDEQRRHHTTTYTGLNLTADVMERIEEIRSFIISCKSPFGDEEPSYDPTDLRTRTPGKIIDVDIDAHHHEYVVQFCKFWGVDWKTGQRCEEFEWIGPVGNEECWPLEYSTYKSILPQAIIIHELYNERFYVKSEVKVVEEEDEDKIDYLDKWHVLAYHFPDDDDDDDDDDIQVVTPPSPPPPVSVTQQQQQPVIQFAPARFTYTSQFETTTTTQQVQQQVVTPPSPPQPPVAVTPPPQPPAVQMPCFAPPSFTFKSQFETEVQQVVTPPSPPPVVVTPPPVQQVGTAPATAMATMEVIGTPPSPPVVVSPLVTPAAPVPATTTTTTTTNHDVTTMAGIMALQQKARSFCMDKPSLFESVPHHPSWEHDVTSMAGIARLEWCQRAAWSACSWRLPSSRYESCMFALFSPSYLDVMVGPTKDKTPGRVYITEKQTFTKRRRLS